VVEALPTRPDWLELAIKVEDVALKVLEEKYPDRPLKTNVEFYAAAVLQGVGLTPDLFPATFALARHAGWTAHVIEQASANRLIRPDARYVGAARLTSSAVGRGSTTAPARASRRPRPRPRSAREPDRPRRRCRDPANTAAAAPIVGPTIPARWEGRRGWGWPGGARGHLHRDRPASVA
jgi:hypothetical protein